ncbi:gliding motility protein GldL [Dokdonia pacifica]|uniref:Protein involved in gliding motility GldL n=1 Tax=Dokdonia pacifica TaxID=1627892 RepID=A0A239DGV3_9FLAO|nr:gliding motility protein GldL [Dokdonia pacifica]GGG36456.1 gliding motility protein GldL [Dokdonia pacifica]SNS31640.1 protein involved in gliding motility GldL [Dokdonia pacifica]
MAKSKSGKKLMNMVYGLGAAVVIIGALFKIMHWPYGDLMLIIGLVTEAGVFVVSAFESVDEDLDWSLVYPELAGGQSKGKKEAPKDVEGLLSQKLDNMLKEAKIDGELMASLGSSIRNFEGAAKEISPTVEAMNSTKKYSEEMALAAAQMESLNSLYKVQVESSSRQAEINEQVTANAGKLKEQMESLATNLSSLNGVYGGMLSAMSK